MKRVTLILAAGLSIAGCGDKADGLHGYAEGKFVMLAPETTGRVKAVTAIEGAHVEAGAPLFQLEDTAEQAALAAARAAAEAAGARFDDAAAGGRVEEIAAARDQVRQAVAVQDRARKDQVRAQGLFNSGTVARAQLDAATAAAETANAQVAELRQRLTLVELPARDDQLRNLTAGAREATAQVQGAADALRRRAVAAPAAGKVERVVRHAGDLAAPAMPVVRFLPDGQMIAVLYIPEPRLAQTPVGTKLAIVCDGCPADARAEITSIANEPEFTPPVIYSDAERARLVFRAEAKFTGFAPPPGTPLRADTVK
jgi:HlyD family secretion protein